MEHLEDVQEAAERVWDNLVRHSGLAELLHAACPYVSTWICLTMQPAKLPFDPAYLIQAKTSRVSSPLRPSSPLNIIHLFVNETSGTQNKKYRFRF